MKKFHRIAAPRVPAPVRSALISVFTAMFFAPLGNLRAMQPLLIPQPRELKANRRPFLVDSRLKIILITPVAQEDSQAAESIQEELKIDTGSRFPIVAAPAPPQGSPAIILGRFDQAGMRVLLAARHQITKGVGNQGYVLDVGRSSVLVAGKDSAGLFYGVQTLRQLVVPTGNNQAKILSVRVRDWPSLQYRGTQVDISRGPVPKLAYLKRIVRTVAEFKMNQLYMYIEDAFRLEGQPMVGVLTDTLSRSDWKTLVAYAARYHVEIVPATEACGHLHKILRFEQYTGMAEIPHGNVLAAGDPHAVDFLSQMYEQMLPVFPSSIYHIGCDETRELGQGRSQEMVQQEGYGKVYVDILLRVAKLLEGYNKQVMFWGDIAVEHPELIPSLPSNLVVASWTYSAHPTYQPWLKPFEGTGMRIFVCPWVGNTSLIVPDYEEAAYDIGNFLADGKQAGAIGTDITVWNDDGETLYGPNWWSIIYGAACAWEPRKTDVKQFNRKFDWAFYRNTDHRFVNAIMRLGHLNEVMRAGGPVDTFDMHFGGTGDRLFWQDPFSPAGQKQVQKAWPVASLLRKTAEQAYTVLVDGSSRAKRNADTLNDLKFAALRLDALGMRYQYAANVLGLGDKNDGLGPVDLLDYTTRLTEMYRRLWLSENLPTWLPNVLDRYRRNSDLWERLIEKQRQGQ